MGTGYGYGKTILIGDQFVLWGLPAVLSAIPFSTRCSVSPGEKGRGWTLEDRRTEVPGYKKAKEKACHISFDRMIEVLGLHLESQSLHIEVGGDLLAGSGVGASAAICVSFVRACNAEFNLGLSRFEINRAAWEGEFAYHGLPSGLDNTVSTFGGVIKYSIREDVKQFERITVTEPVEVVLGNSGVTADTSSLKGFLETQDDENPPLFCSRLNLIRSQIGELEAALKSGDLKRTGRIMSDNHAILKDMGLSHQVLDDLCCRALALGAAGAKVTGGGRGGYMLALTPGKELQARVASDFEARGIATIKTVIGGIPCEEEGRQVLI